MSFVEDVGRFGNNFIRYLAISFIAKKHNLFIIYRNIDNINKMKELGIKLFSGEKKYSEAKILIESNMVLHGDDPNNNYYNILNSDSFEYNIDSNNAISYCQTKYVTDLIYKYLQVSENMNSITTANKFNNRYNNNNDCFIHVRLTDAEQWNSGFLYYNKVLSEITCDNIYLSTDDVNHDIIKQLLEKYPINVLNYDIVDLIQFASTNRYVILSTGTFSAIMGYFSFFSNVYYPKYEHNWHGDIFSIPSWNCINKLDNL